MGRPGTKSKLTKADFADAIKKSKGFVVKAAKILKLNRTHFHEKVTEYGLRDLLREAREDYEEEMVDLAEEFNAWALQNKIEMPAIAQKSAFHILDNLGKKFGYNVKDKEDDKKVPNEELIKLEQENIDIKYENIKLKNDPQRQTDP